MDTYLPSILHIVWFPVLVTLMHRNEYQRNRMGLWKMTGYKTSNRSRRGTYTLLTTSALSKPLSRRLIVIQNARNCWDPDSACKVFRAFSAHLQPLLLPSTTPPSHRSSVSLPLTVITQPHLSWPEKWRSTRQIRSTAIPTHTYIRTHAHARAHTHTNLHGCTDRIAGNSLHCNLSYTQ